MKKHPYLLAILFAILSISVTGQPHYISGPILFDFDWRFHRGGAVSAEKESYNDFQWRKIDLPHDWSVEDLPGTNSPFDKDAVSQTNGGFTTGGTGWYRKHFNIAADQKDKKITIQFDGVYMNADVWLNGKLLGTSNYGYSTFWFDITDKINFGGNNILAVKVRNEGENSRWYSGSGIYRHVWLQVTEPIHIAHWGTVVTTPEIKAEFAKVNQQTKIKNETTNSAKIKITTRLLLPNGVEAANAAIEKLIPPNADVDFNQDMIVKAPKLWSVENPLLYTSVTSVYQNDVLKDVNKTTFGIRTISVHTKNGFQLNGRAMKLKGGCLHHDNGYLGSKAYDRAEERRIEILKESGYNAVRTSHNPPSPAFLEACDRLGMLVIDEAFDMWREAKNPNDYHLYFDGNWQKDIDAMVKRDRNHPSIIMWSTGNEIPNRETPAVVKVSKMLSDYIHKLDGTRMVTAAVNDLRRDKDPFFATLDIGGYNYATSDDLQKNKIFETDHERVPERIMMGTESYALIAFGTWMDVLDHPYVIGDFTWTAFDYIGEASIGWRGYWQDQNYYPWNLAFCGDIDICGWKRPQSYYRDALWKSNQLSVFVTSPKPSFPESPKREEWSKWHWYDVVADWNWKGYEGESLEVNVYSSCEQVELFLNGKSMGKKPSNRSTKFMALWQVPYQAGKLTAIGYTGNKQVSKSELQTAEEPVSIRLSADRTTIQSNGQDLSYITVTLTDTNGIRNPTAENLIHFKVEGAGTIVGAGNANPISTESFQLPQHKAWQGKCLVIIKSGKSSGEIILKATGDGLKAAEIKLLAD